MFTMDDLFEMAVKLEENGEAIYRKALAKTSGRDLKDLLLWMAREEQAHGRWFTDQQKRLPPDPEERRLKEVEPDVLTGMMGDSTLSLDEIDFQTISSPPDLLNLFMGFERETIQFYEVMAMFIEDPAVQEGLRQIIREEEAHVQKLADLASGLERTAGS